MKEYKQALERLLNDGAQDAELLALLETTQEKELEKPDGAVDCALMEECAQAMLELQGEQSEDAAIAERLPTAEALKAAAAGEKRIRFGKLAKVLLIAAIILATTVTANAAVGSLTGTSLVSRLGASVNDTKSGKKHEKTDEETTTQAESVAQRSNYKQSTTRRAEHAYGSVSATTTTTARETTTEEETTDKKALTEPEPTSEDAFTEPASDEWEETTDRTEESVAEPEN